MKKSERSASVPGPRLHTVNQYLEKNFPDFFAEARFHVGNDDYFLYARFGKYLASSIEHRRINSDKISRGFTVLNKLARKAERELGGLDPFSATEVAALIGSAFIGAESLYLLGGEKKGVPVRQALRRFGDLIRIAEAKSSAR